MRISDSLLRQQLLGVESDDILNSVYWIINGEQMEAVNGLSITPKPASEDISGVTVDVHLDSEFQVPRYNDDYSLNTTEIDLSLPRAELSALAAQVFQKHEGDYVLQPGEFCLGSTLETINIPRTLVGWLDGRSTLARFGLLVHVTAHRIDPGWNGKVVLEFYNAGNCPVRLVPGMKIGAVSFETIHGAVVSAYGERADASYKDQDSVLLPGGMKQEA